MASSIDEVYVFCSDESVQSFILPGVHFLKRPSYLDEDGINANDIIREFMRLVNADVYVNAHATSPFAKPETIDECVNQVKSGNYDSALCVEELRTFLWMEGKPLNFNPDSFPRTQDLPTIYGETSIAYVFTRDSFIQNKRRMGQKPFFKTVGRIEAMDIDYQEDFDICNAIYKEMNENGGTNCRLYNS
jgi:CMP-N-acetylneuraminic acid synthetase